MYLHNDFTWLQPQGKLKYLGLSFIATAEGSLTPRGNFDLIQKQISNTLSKLRYQKRSLIGKVRTIKTMLASLFIYRLSLLPTNKFVLKNLDKEFYAVLWENGTHRISRNTMEMDSAKGGFNMLNIALQERSLKFIWLQRLIHGDKNLFWRHQVIDCFKLPIEQVLQLNAHVRGWKALVKKGHVLPEFWKSIFTEWFRCRHINPKSLNPGLERTSATSSMV